LKKKLGDEDDANDSEQVFDVTKIQECSLNQQTTQSIAISPVSTISLPQKRLTYAFTLLQQDTIYVIKQEGAELTTEIDILEDEHLVTTLKGQGAAVTHIAFDQEEGQLLAALSDDKTCCVWDVDQRVCIVTFPLRSPGSAVCWHKSQRYKLMVTERDGWIKFFNVAKQVCVQSINVFRSPLLCADWSPNDCLNIGLGTLGAGLLLDTSVLNTQNTKLIETMSDTVNMLQFSRGDSRMLATVGKPQGELKLWQQGISRHVWSQRKEKVQAFTWLPGKPYIIALAGNNLMVYEASSL
jgi:WD40 repeat protein